MLFYCLLAAFTLPGVVYAEDGDVSDERREDARARTPAAGSGPGVGLPDWAAPRGSAGSASQAREAGPALEPNAPPDFPSPQPVPIDGHAYLLGLAALAYGIFRLWTAEKTVGRGAEFTC